MFETNMSCHEALLSPRYHYIFSRYLNTAQVWLYLWIVRTTGLSNDDQPGSAGVVKSDALQSVYQAIWTRSHHGFRSLAVVSENMSTYKWPPKHVRFLNFLSTAGVPTWLCVRCRHYIFLCVDWARQRTPPHPQSGAPGRPALLLHGRTASCSHQLHTW